MLERPAWLVVSSTRTRQWWEGFECASARSVGDARSLLQPHFNHEELYSDEANTATAGFQGYLQRFSTGFLIKRVVWVNKWREGGMRNWHQGTSTPMKCWIRSEQWRID